MNLKNFANALLDQAQELEDLRSRNHYLETELRKYNEHMRDSNAAYGSMFGKLLDSASDPESHFNKRPRGA